jgi:hypothetical protein
VQGFLSDETALRQRLLKAAVINLLLAPFLLMFLVIYFFMKHAERFYHSPGRHVSSSTLNAELFVPRQCRNSLLVYGVLQQQ